MVISERIRVPARYRLLEEVGQGGMAIVYRAHDASLKRDVAIKLLHDHLSAEPECKARLEREAQAVAKLKHDNILEIFDYSGSDADSAYIVTEFIDGQTLKDFLAARRIRHPEVAALIVSELGAALAHAHSHGIIHRDIKPENVMIRKDGLLKLMDFGIAQVLDLERMTVTGQLLGSPAYMAPELIEGRPLDVRSDVFAVGILLYQIATGALPFSGKNPHEVLRRITEGRFSDPRTLNRLCSATFCRIVARALARDPADRYPEMRALVTDLTEYLAEASLGEARAELGDYFRDPVAYEDQLPARMTPALTAAAEMHLRARAPTRAMESWNRVLAYAPDDATVLAALKRFEGRHRRRMVALYAGASLAAAAALLGVIRLMSPSSSEVARNASARASATTALAPSPALPGTEARAPGAATGPGSASAPSSSPGPALAQRPPRPRPAPGGPDRLQDKGQDQLQDRQTESESAAAPGAPPVAPARIAASPPAVRTFALAPTPQNVDVYLDGERQFSYDTDHRTLNVPWAGMHVVELRSPSGCCFPERLDIGPDAPLPPDNIIARRLKWKPARLVVTTTPPSAKARIMVRDPSHPGGGTVVAPGEEANIPFFAGDEGQKEIEVSVDSGIGFAAERVTVRAGERRTAVFDLGAAP